MVSLFGVVSFSYAGKPGEWPDWKNNSGWDGPYPRGGSSPKGMDGVITPSGVYWSHVPEPDFNENSNENEVFEEEMQEDSDYQYKDWYF